jgi:hypothetical protein
VDSSLGFAVVFSLASIGHIVPLPSDEGVRVATSPQFVIASSAVGAVWRAWTVVSALLIGPQGHNIWAAAGANHCVAPCAVQDVVKVFAVES